MKLKIIYPKYYYKLFVELIHFLIKPTPNKQIELKNSERIRNTIMLFLIDLFLSLIIAFVTTVIFKDNNNIAILGARKLYGPLKLLIIGTLIFPLLEETAFRLSIRFKPIYLALSCCILSYYTITKLIYDTHNADLGNNFVFRCLLAIMVGFIIYFTANKFSENLKTFWEKHFRWILYFSILSFGFVHILNYQLSLKILLLAPIITFPQLFGGAILGFIRIKYGFIYNFSVHSLSNFIAISLSLLLI